MFEAGEKPGAEHQDVAVPATEDRESYRWLDGVAREHRPMDFYLADVVHRLQTEKILIVQAETGVGKTTRIPQAIIDSDPQAQIYMTQTRRPAVRMNARSIAKEMAGLPIDSKIEDDALWQEYPAAQKIGWSLRGEAGRNSAETQLHVLIDQSLVNRIRRERKLPDGYLIVDEAHERTVQIDVLLTLIREYLSNSPNTKVLITSATIDTVKFQNYFATKEPLLAFNEQLYPVETRPERLQRNEHHSEGATRAVFKHILRPLAEGTLTIPGRTKEEPHQNVTQGSVLVLLPGKDDITAVMSRIKDQAEGLGLSGKIEIVSCHGQMQKKEQDLVSRPTKPGVIRIVCATEIIRSSVTVPDVIGVIDSLQVKRYSMDEKGVSRLQKITVSGAEADQGKGRAGRVQPGFYIPISFNQEYENITDKTRKEYWPEPAIQREALTSVVLQFADVGLSMRTLDLLDKPDDKKIEVAIARLQKIGALDDKEEITELGRTMVHFPVEPEKARVLIAAEKYGVLSESIIATAILEQEGVQYFPKRDETDVQLSWETLETICSAYDVPLSRDDLPHWAEKTRDGAILVHTELWGFPNIAPYGRNKARRIAEMVWAKFAGESNSDFYAAVQVFRAYKAEAQRLRDEGYSWSKVDDALFLWCKLHFVNFKKMQMVDSLVRDLVDQVSDSALSLDSSVVAQRDFNASDLTKALLSGLVDNVLVSEDGQDQYRGLLGKGIQRGSTSASRKSEIILVDAVQNPLGTSFFANMVAPIELDWFMEAMPQLCREVFDDRSATFDEETGTVRQNKHVFYSGQEVGKVEVRVVGPLATHILAEALWDGRTGHEAEKTNQNLIAEAQELLKRDCNTFDLKTAIVGWYEKQLGKRNQVSELGNCKLTLSEEVLTELLGENYAQMRQRVLREKPDFVALLGAEIPLVYRYDEKARPAYQVTITISPEQLAQFSWDLLPAFSGYEIELLVEYPDRRGGHPFVGYQTGEKNLEALRREVEKYRQDNRWWHYNKEKEESPEKVTVPAFSPLPPLPSPEVWDSQTGNLAYPAYTSSRLSSEEGRIWYLRWYRTLESARDIQEQSQFEKATYDRKEYERANPEEALAKYQARYAELGAKVEKIKQEGVENYGLTLKEVYKKPPGSPFYDSTSFESQLESIHQNLYPGSVSRASAFQPRLNLSQAYVDMEVLASLLQKAEDYRETHREEIEERQLLLESVRAPELPGKLRLFVIRTPGGKLLAAPAVNKNDSSITRGQAELEGQILEQTQSVIDEAQRLLAGTHVADLVPGDRWYSIPESATITLKVPPKIGATALQRVISFKEIPRAAGVYGMVMPEDSLLGLSESEAQVKDLPAQIFPINYEIKRAKLVANSLFGVTTWLEEYERRIGGKLASRFASKIPYEVFQEVWADAKAIYQRFEELHRLWLSPGELLPRSGLLAEPDVFTELGNLDSVLLTSSTGARSVQETVRQAFSPSPNGVLYSTSSRPGSRPDFQSYPPKQDLRFDKFRALENLSMPELLALQSVKKSDSGKWRLMIAVLAGQGSSGLLEAVKLLESDKRKEEKQQAIEAELKTIQNTLDDMGNEIRNIRNGRLAESSKVQDAVDKAKRNLEMILFIMAVKDSGLVRSWLGDDAESQNIFWEKLAAALAEQFSTWRKLPPIEQLETFVEQIITENF